MGDINWAALTAPVPPDQIKTLPDQAGKKAGLSYVDARFVMDRLDEAVGPENWRDEYQPAATGDAVQCTLYLRIGEEWVGKTDVAPRSNIEGEKGAYSDSFKRAAVKWGIARDLYEQGRTPPGKPATPRKGRASTLRGGGGSGKAGERCGECNAPVGKPHGTGCSKR